MIVNPEGIRPGGRLRDPADRAGRRAVRLPPQRPTFRFHA